MRAASVREPGGRSGHAGRNVVILSRLIVE